MPRSIVNLPSDADDEVEVYVNGVLQTPDVDYYVDRGALIFDRALHRDRVSRWRWFLGAWGVGTYRQDNTVDVRYVADGQVRSRHALAIKVVDDELDESGWGY
jgi:hypothetical protein